MQYSWAAKAKKFGIYGDLECREGHEGSLQDLNDWIDPIWCNSVDMSNLVPAHIIYLFKDYTYEEFNYRSILVLLTLQVFLSINHHFSNEAYARGVGKTVWGCKSMLTIIIYPYQGGV